MKRGQRYFNNMPASCGARNRAMQVAMWLCINYSKKAPRYEKLMERFGMSRATAYRWLGSYKEAMGL